MSRRYLTAPFLITLILIISASNVRALDVTATSCSQADVQTAVNQVLASGNGTVIIPACSPNPTTWASGIAVTATGGKSIRILGSGQTSTYIIGFEMIVPGKISDIIELGNMHLDGNGNLAGVTSTRYRPTSYGKEVYYHDLIISNYDSANHGVFSFEGWYGVVSRVNVTCSGTSGVGGAPYGILVHGDGLYDLNISRLGTRNALFIEDSTFSRCGHTVVGMCDSHIVFRHNIVSQQEHAIDVHEPGYNYCYWATPDSKKEAGDSGGAFELYDNIFQNPNLGYQSDVAFKPRGGWGIVTNNTCNNFGSQNYCLGLKLGDNSDNGGGCTSGTTCARCYTWDGNTMSGCYGCIQSPEQFYFWSNTCPSCRVAADLSEIYEDFGGNGCLRENTDYFLRTPSQAQDGFTWTPYAYPHPLTLSSTPGYYVAKNDPACTDSGPGSESQPWCTVQKAASTAQAGDTVYIKNGTYAERVTIQNSGSAGNYITFKAYPGHKPHITGDGSCSWNGVLNIASKSYIKIQGIELSRQACYDSGAGWVIYIASGENIELTGLDVHHTGADSEQIQVLGASRNIKISNNVVHDGQCASGIDIYTKDGSGSEAGRPQYIEISNNTVYNVNPSYDSCGIGAGIATERVDFASVHDNTVYDSRMGMDIGCGKNDSIYNNRITGCQTGIAISGNEDSEIFSNTISGASDEGFLSYDHEDHPLEVHARNRWHHNIVYDSYLPFEEYHKPSQGAAAESRDHMIYDNLFYGNSAPVRLFDTTNVRFYHNTIYSDPGADGLEVMQDGSTGATVKNNIISVSGSGRYAVQLDSYAYSTATLDNNLLENRASDSIIDWSGTYYSESQINSGVFYAQTGQGQNTVAADPLFASAAANDYHVQSGSPAIDNGSDVGITTDLDNSQRPQGSGYDIGAYEFNSGQPSCVHKSEIPPCDGRVCMSELNTFIYRWYVDSSNPTLKELMESIGLWKSGGC